MDKRLTVIIPGYNTPERWWRRCIASVRSACGPDDEIICVDDGSDVAVDASWVCSDSDNRVRLIRQSNGGLSSARNAALAIAKGKYVSFVDSDDEVCPGVFDECIKALSHFGADIAIFGVRVIWPDDGLEKTDSVGGNRLLGKLSPNDILRLYHGCLLNYACNKVYRVDFLRRNSLRFNTQAMPCEDIVFNLSCIMAGAIFCEISYAGYVYYRTRGTLLSRYKPTSFVGTRLASEAWHKYKDTTPGANEILGDLGEMSTRQEQYEEWRNIWMPGSPYSLMKRWEWLKEHSGLGGAMVFFRMMLWTFVRRHFYFQPIRRRHIKRLYPYAINWKR